MPIISKKSILQIHINSGQNDGKISVMDCFHILSWDSEEVLALVRENILRFSILRLPL